MINVIAIAIGALVAAFGLIGIVRPSNLLSVVTFVWNAAWGPYWVAAARVGFGVILIVAAPESRFPITLGVVAVLAVIGGLAAPVFGRERALRFVDWWKRQHPTFVRAWAVAAAAFGAFVVYACL